MIELKTAKEIEEMKPAGRFVGEILKELKAMTKVGTNLLEIDEYVHKKIVDRKGAESCYVDYAPDFGTGPFAHYICTSVNDAVLHGIPFDYNLKDGDLVSLDLAISFNGFNARTEHTNPFEHLGRNKNFLLVIGALLVLQFLFVTFGGAVLSVEPLSWTAWLVCLLIAFLIIPIDIIRKAITSKKK